MFNLASRYLQCGFSRGRYFKRLGAKAGFARARGPERFCFSWRSRHVRVSHSIPQSKTLYSQLTGEEYLIVREDEVLGVLEGPEMPATKVA